MSPRKTRQPITVRSDSSASFELDDASSEDHRQGDGQVPDLASFLTVQNEGASDDDGASDQQSRHGLVEHLDSHAPIGSGSRSDNEAPEEAPATHIGKLSQEELEAMNQAASNQLRTEVAGLGRLPKVKKSKLSMPTKSRARGVSLPASKVPTQRRLAKFRPNPYDELEDHPLNGPVVLISRSAADKHCEISPRRNQRKPKIAPVEDGASSKDSDAVSPACVPRRSPRKLLPEAQDAQNTSGVQKQPETTVNPPRRGPGRPREVRKPGNIGTSHDAESSDIAEPSQGGGTLDEQADTVFQDKTVYTKLRPSELFPREDAAEDGLGSDTGSTKSAQHVRPSVQPRKRKRLQDPGVRPAKRTKSIPPSTNDDQPSVPDIGQSPQPPDTDQHHEPRDRPAADSLLGQWQALRELRRQSQTVGDEDTRSEVTLNDIDVVSVLSSVKKAQLKLTKLRDDGINTGNTNDPPDELKEIERKIKGLCGKDPQLQTDFDDSNKSENIYLYLIPRMVRFLVFSAQCYMSIDRSEATSTRSVTIDHLRVLTEIADSIVKLGNVAKHQYKRPRGELAIIKPVHNGLIVPLKSVHKAFDRHVVQHQQSQQVAAQRAQRQAEEAARLRNDEALRAQMKEIDRLEEKWKGLHRERREADQTPRSYEDQLRLRFPVPVPELDQNGELFQRADMLRRRIGPPLAMVEQARRRVWQLAEMLALVEGLRVFAGPMVFENIIRKHCGRGGLLSKYTVTEIVTIAVDAKELLEKQGEVGEWVEMIPVWTKPHVLLGKENGGDEQEEP